MLKKLYRKTKKILNLIAAHFSKIDDKATFHTEKHPLV